MGMFEDCLRWAIGRNPWMELPIQLISPMSTILIWLNEFLTRLSCGIGLDE
jgi:hypothetical protein